MAEQIKGPTLPQLSIGRNCAGSIPGVGISTCCRCVWEKKKKLARRREVKKLAPKIMLFKLAQLPST